MNEGAPSLRHVSTRVALAATGVVAAVYLVISVAVVALVTANLERGIDARLTDALERIEQGPMPREGRPFEVPGGGRRFGPTLLVWSDLGNGVVASNVEGAELPVAVDAITTPATITVAATEVRVAGVRTARGHVVVGQTLEAVDQARSTVVGAELAIAPILLFVVFLGAVAIGRRAAAPIEAARLRQMEFTADASHELRTPLSVIEAQTSLALAGERSAEWYRGAFGRVERESARMRRLVDDMLWLARFDAARGAPTAEPVDLGLLAEGAVDRFGTVAEARGITLALISSPGSHVVSAPPEWLDRLVGVLLDNACRYASEGGTVGVGVRVEDGRVALVVEDDGPGIAPEQRERIFDRFHRATDEPGGSGLGLAIGDAVVRATGGRWRIGSSPAGGASMAVSWPRALRDDGGGTPT